jgi:hypothetical protein
MPVESLVLRRCYPVPVTDADNARAREIMYAAGDHPLDAAAWHAAIKEATGAIDEVYAVIDGHEVRVAIASNGGGVEMVGGPRHIAKDIADLLIKADEQGYWERPHEVIHVLEERAISRRTVDIACGVTPDRTGA